MRTQREGEHPSTRLLRGPVSGFAEALELVDQQFTVERALLDRHDALDREEAASWDTMAAQVSAAVRHARRVWGAEQEAARLRTVVRLRADALAAEAALDDEAARWLELLAAALEQGDYSGLAI